MVKPKSKTLLEPVRATEPKKTKNGMVLNKMFRSIKILTARIKTLEAQINSSRNPSSEVITNHTQQMNTSLTADRRILYTLQSQNPVKPKFDNTGKVHPIEFLEDLVSYLRKFSTEGLELDIIKECLEGEARDWARLSKDRWTNFLDFKRDFLNAYWGEAEQNLLRRNIVCGTWDRKAYPTMLSYFLHLAGLAKMVNFPIPELQLIADIMAQFPQSVQYAWSVHKNPTLLEAAEFLRKLDSIYRGYASRSTAVYTTLENSSHGETNHQASRGPDLQVRSSARVNLLGVEEPLEEDMDNHVHH